MAELDTSGGGGHGHGKGKVRAKKLSTRVDLTPMVDLAFLLITFFMLTTTLNKPSAMELNMPKKDDVEDKDKPEVRECHMLNVLLDTLDQVWYYEGLTVADVQKTTFAGDAGIRKQILRTKKRVEKECGQDKTGKNRPMICLIKLLPGARYKNMVDILDEMDINQVPVYAIQDYAPIEKEAIDNGGKVKSFATEGAPQAN
jgi:biopolymer transport protein ExbD